MNLRLQEQNLKFKITADELTSLLDSQTVESKVTLPVMSCLVQIQPNNEGGNILSSSISTENDTAIITLDVPQNMLCTLRDMGRNRDGIMTQQNDVSLTLQVDFRKDKADKKDT